MPTLSAREYLANEVALRASHLTAEQVRTTCSFARAERLLGREYHGRFLIELLQNAADAWRNDPRSATARSQAVVRITNEPALLVANRGAPMTAQVVIESLGHIGASTKAQGEAIGHKGIGFKSVLEITTAPEIYSGLQAPTPELAVAFDPVRAAAEIRSASPDWDVMVAEVQGLDAGDPFAAIPLLRFPYWVNDLPSDVAALASEGFDTVVRLPFVPNGRRVMGRDAWLSTVRDALRDVSDPVLLLLGCFSQVRVEDQAGTASTTVFVEWDAQADVHRDSSQYTPVRIVRNGQLSSRWRLYHRSLSDLEHLAGELAVGVRLVDEASGTGSAAVVSAIDDGPAAPFHLFFPTRIPSGLPFLLHGYFEVDAGRTNFYPGSLDRNRQLLAALAGLTAQAVADIVARGDVDLVTLVELVAEAGEPEDLLARAFREDVLTRLDDIPWIPVQTGAGVANDRPTQVVVGRAHVVHLIGRTFPADYVRRKVGLGLPNERLSERALELISNRQPEDGLDVWSIVAMLCRPGDDTPWDVGSADDGFRSLHDLLTALQGEDRRAADRLVDSFRGDPASRVLPTVGPDGSRVLLPVPDPSEGVAGRRTQLVLARARTGYGSALPPPHELDLAFLPPGLLENEADIDRAKPLGVRPFTVDNVIDRLNGIEATSVDPETLLRFVWHLLVNERLSSFGTRRSRERATEFDPSEWYWCRPNRAGSDDTERQRQQRARYLSRVSLPSRAGGWRPAGELAFGSDWADWLADGNAGPPSARPVQDRIAAYGAMEAIRPDDGAMLASPVVVLPYLSGGPSDSPTDKEDGDEGDTGFKQAAEQLAFLLRLGVWEVPPIESFDDRTRRDRAEFPWVGPYAELQATAVKQSGGWRFGADMWKGSQHHNVYLAEDHRFQWSLAAAAAQDPHALVIGLGHGAKLYADRIYAHVFCDGCQEATTGHSKRYESNRTDAYPSTLALQLRHDPWVPCTLDGVKLDSPLKPASAWWQAHQPTGAGLRQSPYRLLPLCGPSTGVHEPLRDLAAIQVLASADAPTIERLLMDLRERFDNGAFVVGSSGLGGYRQPFVGLHRLAYERLERLAEHQPDPVAAILARTGMLCDLGDRLAYRPVAEARHDDGRFAAYVRHFVGDVPLVVLPRDRASTADRLGVAPLVVELERRSSDEGRDVTDDVRSFLGDRLAELLAIVVHHSLGTQTLEVTSTQFEMRARRLQNLTVRQMDDLVVDARVPGSSRNVVLGEHSDQDLFLAGATSAAPVLYHDLTGDGWQDRLRRKIAPHLATVLENAAYTHTFALFLQADGDAEREEFLLELGISGDDIEAMATRVGVVGEEERRRSVRWFAAVPETLGSERLEISAAHDPIALAAQLAAAGLAPDVARRLVEFGGGETSRRDLGDGCPLRLLAASGVDLRVLDANLRGLGDSGLEVVASRRDLQRWLDAHGGRLAAVLSTTHPPDIAKDSVRMFDPPRELEFVLDPPLPALLAPVVDRLATIGLLADAEALARDARTELARLGGFASVADMDAQVLLLYDEEEQRRMLRERGAQWRREIILLAVLARSGPSETRSTLRSIHDTVISLLPQSVSGPAALADAVAELFSAHSALAASISEQLVDSINASPPRRDELLALAERHGIAVERLTAVVRALDAPRREQARALMARSKELKDHGVAPTPPQGLSTPPTKPERVTTGPKPVATIKVSEQLDRRKKELGDEGEQWVLAAILGPLMAMASGARDAAIDEILALLDRFEGAVVRKVAEHATIARSADLEDDERTDALTDLLHVAKFSDAFGFDIIGWLPPAVGKPAHAMCLEVKSSAGSTFHMSAGEWSVAKDFHDAGCGDRYAVLVVRRGQKSGIPVRMDLLVDPVALAASGHLRATVDGFQVTYGTA